MAHGILAIFNNVAPGREAEFEEWFQGEHLAERLAVPGFLFGRRHQAISGSSAFFNFYLTESPDVLTSKPYRDRLDNPTPMTRKVMSEIFADMNRTVCRRVARFGSMRGAYVVTVRLNEKPDEAALRSQVEKLAQDRGVASAEIWISADSAGPLSEEEKLRGGDKKIQGCLLIDTLRQADAEKLGARMTAQFPKAEVGVFRVLCQLGRGDI